jgi:hypothetical protein
MNQNNHAKGGIGILTLIENNYGIKCVTSLKDLKTKPIGEILFQDKFGTHTLPDVYMTLIAKNIKNDEAFVNQSKYIEGEDFELKCAEDFYKLVKDQKTRVRNAKNKEAMELVNSTSSYSENRVEELTELNFDNPDIKRLDNEADYLFFSNIIKDNQNYYHIGQNKRLTLLSTDQYGNIDISEVNRDLLLEENDLVRKYILDLNHDLAMISPESLSLADKPIEELFIKSENSVLYPYFLWTLVDLYKVYKIETINNDDGEREVKTLVGYKVKNKKKLGPPNALIYINYIFSNMSMYIDKIVETSNDLRYFSNDPEELAILHYQYKKTANKDLCESSLREAVKKTIPPKWKEYFNKKMSDHLLFRLIYFLGMIQDADNYSNQYLSISDGGGTGKSTLLNILKDYFNKMCPNFVGSVTNNILQDEDKFSIASSRCWEHRLLMLSEYDGKSMSTSNGKRLTGGDDFDVEVKFKNSRHITSKYMKFIVMSNEKQSLRTLATRRRCIPITFSLNHDGDQNFGTKDREELLAGVGDLLTLSDFYYRNTKLHTRDGSYFVLCEEDMALYLNGKLKMDDETRLLRVFSKDTEISSFYFTGDYTETETSMMYTDFIKEIVDIDANEVVIFSDFIKQIEDYFNMDGNETSVYHKYFNFNRNLKGSELKTNNDPQWKVFKKFMKEQLNLEPKLKSLNGKTKYLIKGIKLKSLIKLDQPKLDSFI